MRRWKNDYCYYLLTMPLLMGGNNVRYSVVDGGGYIPSLLPTRKTKWLSSFTSTRRTTTFPLVDDDSNCYVSSIKVAAVVQQQEQDDDHEHDDHHPQVVVSSQSSSSCTTQQTQQQQRSSQTVYNYYIKGIALRTGPLNFEVARIANVSLANANDLIRIGAVWARMDTLSKQDLLLQYNNKNNNNNDSSMSSSASASASILYADLGRTINDDDESNDHDLEDYVERMEERRYRRILSPCQIEVGTDLRIYRNPKRFPSCYTMTRERNLLYEDTTFVVVDKPPMLPTQPDASNYIECCPGCVSITMGPFRTITGEIVVNSRPLLCHRVDSCVGGCVVLSKDINGQRVFAKLQRNRKVRKLYLAVTTTPVPLGMHIHWMYASQTKTRGGQRKIKTKMGGPPCQLIAHKPPTSRRKARQFWTRCALEVVKCEPISIGDNDYDYDAGNTQHYQSTIRLVTGRKHQVRAQLASLGCPIIRDTLYESMAGYTFESLETNEEGMDAAVAATTIPTQPIGLQAHAILFGGIRAKARTPWWGDNVQRE